MTTITYHKGIKCSIRIEGHACAAPAPGESDLCCAAESMLACTLVRSVERLPLAKRYIYVTEGCVCVSFCALCPAGLAGLAALSTVINGFKLLTEQYPQNVKLVRQRRIAKGE